MNDEEQQALAKAQARYRKQVKSWTDAGISDAIASRNGRALLWWLLQISGVYSNPFRDNALRTAFNSGELNIGLQLQARIMEVNPDGFLAMMKENDNDHRTLTGQSGNDDDSDTDSGNAG